MFWQLSHGLLDLRKDRGLTPEKVSRFESNGQDKILKIYLQYQERLKILNATDFGDLLLHTLTIFSNFPDVLLSYQEQFRYILVDEYQDTNVSQYLWLRLLAQKNQNLTCVGDDDQSIYGWRGAEVENILRFEKDFPTATIVRLEQNYRSTAHILGAASGLISKNHDRLGKTLWTEYDAGEKVLVRGTWDSEDEARFVGDAIEALQRKGEDLSAMAILIRAGFQTREFEERFLKMGIPYRVLGGLRFYERQEIRDALAYCRLLVQPHDGLAFERIINTPKRGVGSATLQLIHQKARAESIALPIAALQLVETEELRGAVRTSLRNFFTCLQRWRDLLQRASHVDVIKVMLDESGYTDFWRNDRSPEAPGRLENLKEFIKAVEDFESLPGFLEHVSLVMDNAANRQSDMVNIMTLHTAKGLEFNTVFLAGWEEGVFPHPRSLDENGTVALEEERRLAYVGLTRARKMAIVTYALHRRLQQHGWQFTTPSRFIKELPADHIEIVHPNGARGDNALSNNLRGNNQHSVGIDYSSKALPSPSPLFQCDDAVFHDKFGYGTIIACEGERLEVQFDTSGIKRIMATYVQKV